MLAAPFVLFREEWRDVDHRTTLTERVLRDRDVTEPQRLHQQQERRDCGSE